MSLFAVVLAAIGPVFGAVLHEDFEDQIVGETPAGVVALAPAHASATLAVRIVGGADNLAGGGTGKGVQLLDLTGKALAWEYRFGRSAAEQASAVKVSFDIAWTPEDFGEKPVGLTFALGPWGDEKETLNVGERRLFTASFFTDGRCQFVGGKDSKTKASSLQPKRPSRFVFLVNDRESGAINTNGPDGKPLRLEANSFAVFQDGKRLHVGRAPSLAGGEGRLGRLGFASYSRPQGFNFTVDNLIVELLD